MAVHGQFVSKLHVLCCSLLLSYGTVPGGNGCWWFLNEWLCLVKAGKEHNYILYDQVGTV